MVVIFVFSQTAGCSGRKGGSQGRGSSRNRSRLFVFPTARELKATGCEWVAPFPQRALSCFDSLWHICKVIVELVITYGQLIISLFKLFDSEPNLLMTGTCELNFLQNRPPQRSSFLQHCSRNRVHFNLILVDEDS
jgi:hypothetical protein